MEIIYLDNHLLLMNKPAGLLTQPNEREQNSLEMQGKAWLKQEYHKPGQVFLEAVHRLDRPVSGLVLFARTSKALSRLQSAIRSQQCQKQYLALVEGELPMTEEQELSCFLLHDQHRAELVASHTAGAKHALLKYRVLQHKAGCSLLAIRLITGRYHQIRAQCALFLGHPIVGDIRYGAKSSTTPLLLHHHHLTFPHPITKQPLSFTAPLPPYFLARA